LYQQLGDHVNALRLARGRDRVTILIEQGRLDEAAQEAEREGAFELAADLYHRQGDSERELEELVAYARAGKEAERWQRVPKLARKLGRFEVEAEALRHGIRPLGRYLIDDTRQAAQAYVRAAQQVLLRPPHDEARAAELYAAAWRLYEKVYLAEQAKESRAQHIRYGRLPYVLLERASDEPLQLGEYRDLTLMITNAGHGLATGIQIEIGSEVEPQNHEHIFTIPGLPDGGRWPYCLTLRPRDDLPGSIHIHFKIQYADPDNMSYEETFDIKVFVRARESDTIPPIPQLNVTGGTVQFFQAPVTRVISGSEYHGDVGDKVIVQRVGLAEAPQSLVWREPSSQGAGLRAVEEQTKLCPTCSLPVGLGDDFCQACGLLLKPREAGGAS
jgi:hypothetical protein